MAEMEESMAKIKIHELAKELDKQSKDIISFLQEKGIEAKAAQSSIEEDAAQMVRKAFGKAQAPQAEAAQTQPSRTETPKAEPSKGEASQTEAAKAPDAPKAAAAPAKAEGQSQPPKKKKKIIFVSNPQNSKMPGQKQGGQPNRPAGQQARTGGQQNRSQSSYNSRPRAEAPVRPIKPLTPPSPTPSVQMVPSNKNQPSRPRADKPKNQEPANSQAQTQAQAKPGTQPQQAVRPDRPVRDGQGQDNRSRDGRGQGSRPQNQEGRQQGQPGRGGASNGRYQNGERQSGFQRPGRPGAEGGQSGQGDRRSGGGSQGGGRGFNNSNRDNRGMRSSGGNGTGSGPRDNKPGKSFASEAPSKDMEKKREEEKRRFSQERDKRSKKDHIYEEEEALKNKPGRFIKPEKKKEETAEEVIKVITLPETITIKDLADKMKLQPSAIVKKLFLEGKIVTVNQEISYEDAENIAMEYDILCEKEVKVDVIEELLKEEDEDEANLVERPPVICVMGHVDHGKTSLLDAIRKTNVTDKEAGGITQHIGAYTVNVGERKITFLDTPGHEAFTAMRMRGANSTDIAILVVAADDGVMPQTVEAINHAKAAGIEIIVAVNKIDKPSANIDRVRQELAEYELIPEDWGGSTVFAPVSAKTGEGIEQLLEMILLTADILELKANPNRRARGLVIEAELDKGRGPVATVLVQKGTLHVGDFVSAGASHGKVRAMVDDKGRRVKEAGPSTPVEILGLSDVPSAGEVFLAHDSDKTAKSYAETYLAQNKEKMLEETKGRMSLDDLFSQIKEGNLKELNLIVKADVQGSVEAVKQSLMKLSNEEVVVKCIHGGVGAINESDVTLASASNAIIIGFNVRPDATAKATAEREGVDVRLYKVIYQAIEDIEAAMKGMLDPVFEEKVIGHAEVRQIFKASAIGNIAGAYVLDGEFLRGCKIRISREGKQIYEGALASLKRFKDDVKEVKAGFECGLVFEGFDQMQEFDIVEAYIMVEVPR